MVSRPSVNLTIITTLLDRAVPFVNSGTGASYYMYIFPRSISILWLGVQRKKQSHLVPCTKLLIYSPFLGFVLFTSPVSKSKCSKLHGKVLIGCFSRHLYIYIKLRETMDTILRTLPNQWAWHAVVSVAPWALFLITLSQRQKSVFESEYVN